MGVNNGDRAKRDSVISVSSLHFKEFLPIAYSKT